MVQFLIDIAHMIAALALSLVGISYEPSEQADSSDQEALFHTGYAYVSDINSQTQYWRAESSVQRVEATQMIREVSSGQSLHIQVGKLDMNVETYDILFDDNLSAPAMPSAPVQTGRASSECSTPATVSMSRTVVQDI